MTACAASDKPLWLLFEEKILELPDQDLSRENQERTIQRIAAELDNSDHNVSCVAGNMLQLRWAVDSRLKVGRPFMKDFNDAVEAFTLEDLTDTSMAAIKLIHDVGKTWQELKESQRRPDVLRIIEKTKLHLLITKAKGLPDDEGVRLLIDEGVSSEIITQALGITEEKYNQVLAAVEEERAVRAGVVELLKAVEGKSDEEKVRHLISKNVSKELIVEIAGVDESVVAGVIQSMEAELKEKQRQAEEAAALKKAEAEGPPLEEIPPDQMLEYIESIREILEFSEKEEEIRVMCGQSAIPKCLVDIAVSQPDRLDELESEAEG